MLGLDKETYGICYKSIIEPVAAEYCKKNYGLSLRSDAMKRIWINYAKFNRYCREEYMRDPNKLMDRHKIVACYIYAIIKSDVLIFPMAQELEEDKKLLINERLALCFGLSLLRLFIQANADKLKDEILRTKVKEAFDGEIMFPKTNHGDYKQNLLLQLYHTKRESSYNILALADSLFLIESYNLIKNDLPEDIFHKHNKNEN